MSQSAPGSDVTVEDFKATVRRTVRDYEEYGRLVTVDWQLGVLLDAFTAALDAERAETAKWKQRWEQILDRHDPEIAARLRQESGR